MQAIIVEKPYKFIPPRHSTRLPALVERLGVVDWYLRRFEGVVDHELRGAEHLQASLARKDGVLLAPNHCRYADPLVMVYLARHLKTYPYAMASWHLFHQGRLQATAMKTIGAFSIYREGPDRESLDTAIDILTEARRPLVLFPEGAVFRTNDRLHPLLDGVSLIARAAAKRRAKLEAAGRVVVHPVAIKYVPLGSVATMVEPILYEIERRFTWEPAASGPLGMVDRLTRAMQGLLCIKEIEYLGAPQCGSWPQRQNRLIEALLQPLELEYLKRAGEGPILPRIKSLRSNIVPLLLKADTSERHHLWGQLARIYLSQQVASYPHDYLDSPTTQSRVLETAERLYEDLYDRSYRAGPLKVILEIGPPIEVATHKQRGEGAPDLMDQLQRQLQGMLDRLATESPPWPPTQAAATHSSLR